MRTYLVLFIISFVIALLLTPLVRRFVRKLGSKSKLINNKKTAPQFGGVVIWAAVILTLCVTPLLRTQTAINFWQNSSWYLITLLPATVVLLCGIYEDWRGTNLFLRVGGQLAAAFILYESGYVIHKISLPLDKELDFPLLVGFPLLVLWVMLITNSLNLVASLDGVPSVSAAFAFFTLLFFSILSPGSLQVSLLSIVLIGAVLGFLYYNFPPSSIYLGNSGTSFFGVLLATLSISASQKSNTFIAVTIPLIAFGLPILELCLSLGRYIVNKGASQSEQPEHIHHALLSNGLTVRQVFILLYAVVATVTLVWSLLFTPRRVVSGFIFAFIGIVSILIVQRLRYSQLEEFGYKVRDSVIASRSGNSVNAQIRHICSDIRHAYTPARVLGSLGQLFQLGEFEAISLELNLASYSHYSQVRAVAEEQGWHPSKGTDNIANPKLTLWRVASASYSKDITITNGFWGLAIPLQSSGQSLGVLTLYSRPMTMDASINLKNLCNLLQEVLSEKLIEMQLILLTALIS